MATMPTLTEPKAGQIWRHTNGHEYLVLYVTNTAVVREGHPPDVVYETYYGLRGEGTPAPPQRVWSRPLSDWHRSFTYTGWMLATRPDNAQPGTPAPVRDGSLTDKVRHHVAALPDARCPLCTMVGGHFYDCPTAVLAYMANVPIKWGGKEQG